MVGGKRLGVAGVALASLALASCINFAPAVSSQASTVEGGRSVAAEFGDVTGDGSDDVIVAVSLPGADALVRMAPCGGGCLERREQVLPGEDVVDLAASDFDGDGVEDVAASSPATSTTMAMPTSAWAAGSSTTSSRATVAEASHPWSTSCSCPAGRRSAGLASGDVDGDGDPEVLVTESGLGATNILGSVVAFRDGTSAIASYTEEGLLFAGVTAADVNGDHLDDVAVVRFVPDSINFRDVRLLRSTGTGFTRFGSGGALTSLPSRAVAMELRDIDLDGRVPGV